jgi:hypothetical protein
MELGSYSCTASEIYSRAPGGQNPTLSDIPGFFGAPTMRRLAVIHRQHAPKGAAGHAKHGQKFCFDSHVWRLLTALLVK